MEELDLDINSVSSEDIEEVINGCDRSNKGDNVLLFLKKKKYYITGSYKGIFKLIDNNKVQLTDELINENQLIEKEDIINEIKDETEEK